MCNGFIQKLNQLLENNNISARRLALSLGFSSNKISEWKSGKIKPSVDDIAQIADYFNVSADYLLNRHENTPKIDYMTLLGARGILTLKRHIKPLIEDYGFEKLSKEIGITTKDIRDFFVEDIVYGNTFLQQLDKALICLNTNLYELYAFVPDEEITLVAKRKTPDTFIDVDL